MKTKLAFLLAVGALAAVSFSQAKTEFEARLTGSGKGKAKFKTKGNQSELEVEAENLLRTTRYTVTVADRSWTVTTDALRQFHLELRFFGNAAPAIAAGTAVTVKNSAGAVVLTGTFAAK